MRYGNPWEIRAPRSHSTRSSSTAASSSTRDEHGVAAHRLGRHRATSMAMAYDIADPRLRHRHRQQPAPVGGHGDRAISTCSIFNEGDYIAAVEDKNESENLSKVLYPDDTTATGQRAAPASSSTSSSRARCRTSCAATQKQHDGFDDSARQGRDPAQRHPSGASPSPS
ncbi:MAG: glycogen/starch/alpha-glucan phosphorylase [Chromatiales bacterium]|nr:glycogen/starch/alpha-glucan phosphorylase [Chromatiales bacterium]